MSGKGSKPRPFAVSQDEYADRFDAIFGKKEKGDARADDGVPSLLDTEAPERVPDAER